MSKSSPSLLMGLEIKGEFLPIWLHDFAGFMEEHFSAHWIDEDAGVQAIFGLKRDASVPTVFALLFMREKGWDKEKAGAWLGDHPEFLPTKLAEALEKFDNNKILLRLLRSPMSFIPSSYKLQPIDKTTGVFSVLGVTMDNSLPRPVALIFSGKGWDEAKIDEWLATRQGAAYRREW